MSTTVVRKLGRVEFFAVLPGGLWLISTVVLSLTVIQNFGLGGGTPRTFLVELQALATAIAPGPVTYLLLIFVIYLAGHLTRSIPVDRAERINRRFFRYSYAPPPPVSKSSSSFWKTMVSDDRFPYIRFLKRNLDGAHPLPPLKFGKREFVLYEMWKTHINLYHPEAYSRIEAMESRVRMYNSLFWAGLWSSLFLFFTLSIYLFPSDHYFVLHFTPIGLFTGTCYLSGFISYTSRDLSLSLKMKFSFRLFLAMILAAVLALVIGVLLVIRDSPIDQSWWDQNSNNIHYGVFLGETLLFCILLFWSASLSALETSVQKSPIPFFMQRLKNLKKDNSWLKAALKDITNAQNDLIQLVKQGDTNMTPYQKLYDDQTENMELIRLGPLNQLIIRANELRYTLELKRIRALFSRQRFFLKATWCIAILLLGMHGFILVDAKYNSSWAIVIFGMTLLSIIITLYFNSSIKHARCDESGTVLRSYLESKEYEIEKMTGIFYKEKPRPGPSCGTLGITRS